MRWSESELDEDKGLAAADNINGDTGRCVANILSLIGGCEASGVDLAISITW